MKLGKIKWENIVALILGSWCSYCMTIHIIRNGFEFNAVFGELMIYGIVTLCFYLEIKGIRNEFFKK